MQPTSMRIANVACLNGHQQGLGFKLRALACRDLGCQTCTLACLRENKHENQHRPGPAFFSLSWSWHSLIWCMMVLSCRHLGIRFRESLGFRALHCGRFAITADILASRESSLTSERSALISACAKQCYSGQALMGQCNLFSWHRRPRTAACRSLNRSPRIHAKAAVVGEIGPDSRARRSIAFCNLAPQCLEIICFRRCET